MSILKKNGKYIVTVSWGSREKRQRKSKTFSSMAAAKQWEREIKNAAEDLNMDGYDITFKILAAQWLRHKKEIGIAHSTYAKYDNAVRFAERFPFYNKKAREIKMPEIEKALNSLALDYSKGYISDIKATLSAVFMYGIDQDYLIKNPVSRAALPKHTKQGRTVDSYTEEEVTIIESHKDDTEFGDVVYVVLHTGLRGQEVCCIDKDSIWVKDGQPYLKIDKAMTRVNGHWIVGETKTESSKRINPINDEVYHIILRRVMRSPQNHFIDGNVDGYISYSNYRKKVKKFFSDIDMRYLPPHCLRHTFASRCEWNDIKPSVTKEFLGHATIDMTEHYTHTMNKNKIEAVANFK